MRTYREKTKDTGYELHVDYRVLETLKGTYKAALQNTNFDQNPSDEFPKLHQHIIVFVFVKENEPAFAPVTDDNLQEIRAGIAEDAVDIPKKW